MSWLKNSLYGLLRWSERYTKTDMVYLAKSGLWINLGSLTVSGFSFLLYLAFAHFLPKEVYGTYQYLIALGAIIGAFTLTGMNSAVMRAVARGQEGSLRASVRIQLVWGVLPLVVAWGAALYYFLQGNMLLGWGLALIGIFVPLNNALNTYGALPGGRKDFRGAFLFNFATNLLYYPALIVAAYFSDSALILLAANLVSQAVALSLLYYIAMRVYKPNTEVDPDTISYGKHLTVMGFIGTVAQQLDNVLIFHFLGAAPLALYSFATGIPDRIANLTKFLSVAAFPKIATRDPEEVRKSLGGKIVWALLGSALVTLLYILLAKYLFAIFFPQYMSAVPYSLVYALIIIPMASSIFSAALTAGREVRALYLFNTISPVVQIALLVAGVLLWGLWGLVAARLSLAVVQFGLSGWLFFHPVQSRNA